MTGDSLRNPELQLSLAYAPASARPALAICWRLDEALAAIIQSTSEPMIGQMRMTWWHEAIAALATKPPPAEPLLSDIATTLMPRGLMPDRLLPLVEGWEVLLDPLPWDEHQLIAYARGRGEGVFTAATTLSDSEAAPAIAAAGRGWALADLAFHCSDRATAETALRLARVELANLPRRWPVSLRHIGLLAILADRDTNVGLDTPRRAGSPTWVFRALWHRITGR